VPADERTASSCSSPGTRTVGNCVCPSTARSSPTAVSTGFVPGVCIATTTPGCTSPVAWVPLPTPRYVFAAAPRLHSWTWCLPPEPLTGGFHHPHPSGTEATHKPLHTSARLGGVATGCGAAW